MPYKDKKDQREGSHRHYIKNKEKIKLRAHIWTVEQRQKARVLVNNYKATHGCFKCNIKDFRCLDFHHTGNNKVINIGVAINRAWSLSHIQKEMEKCKVVCSNCHRILTYENTHLQSRATVSSLGS